MQQERRWVRVVLEEKALLAMLTRPEYRVRCNGLPPDASMVHVYPDMAMAAVVVIFAHPSFEPVPLGQVIPIREDLIVEVR